MCRRFGWRRLLAWLSILMLPFAAACGSARPAAPSPEAIETAEKQFDRVDTDLTSAYEYMRDELHMPKIFLVGASMGATASLAVATEQPVAAVVAISALAQFPPLDALMSAEQLDDVPKLFV